METSNLTYENFLFELQPEQHAFVEELHEHLTNLGYKQKLEMAKSGYVVSYQHPKTKRVVMNYVFRKDGLMMRIYADHVGAYMDLVGLLPEGMAAHIKKEARCKQLSEPFGCNSRCPKGYVVQLDGEQYIRCRYQCFFFPVTPQNMPHLRALVTAEAKQRIA